VSGFRPWYGRLSDGADSSLWSGWQINTKEPATQSSSHWFAGRFRRDEIGCGIESYDSDRV